MSIAVHVDASKPEQVEALNVGAINRLQANAQQLMAKAMELTDSWGQAMFILDRATVEHIFRATGFSQDVTTKIYDAVRSLGYVEHREHGMAPHYEFTYHALDATCLVLRGIPLSRGMAGVDDRNVESFIDANRDLFDRVMSALPEYTRHLMFSPEVGARVVTSLGGNLSADRLYDLAWKYGMQVTVDLEGRRGISTQFIRALTLTISARI